MEIQPTQRAARIVHCVNISIFVETLSGPALHVHPPLLPACMAEASEGKPTPAILDTTNHCCQALQRKVESDQSRHKSLGIGGFCKKPKPPTLTLHSVMLIRQLMLRLMLAGPTSCEAAPAPPASPALPGNPQGGETAAATRCSGSAFTALRARDRNPQVWVRRAVASSGACDSSFTNSVHS